MSDEVLGTTQTTAAPAAVEAPSVPTPVETAPSTEAVPDVSGMPTAQKRQTLRRHFTEQARRATERPVEAPAADAVPAEPVVDAKGNLHAPDTGQFAGRAETPEAAPVAEATAAAPADTQAAKPPELVRIPVPEGHSLREQGITEIPTTPEAERAVRNALNSDVRRRQVEERDTRIAQLERERIAALTQANTWREAAEAFFGSPENAQVYAELKAANPEWAEAFKRGKMAEFQEQIAGKQAEAEQAYQQQLTQEHGRNFARDVYGRAQEMNVAGWWLQENALRVLGAYGWEIDQGFISQPSAEQALDRLLTEYKRDPRIKPHLDAANLAAARQLTERLQQEERAKALAERQQAEADRLRDAATRHATRPPLTPAMQTGAQVQTANDDAELRKLPADKQRKLLRNWAGALAARR